MNKKFGIWFALLGVIALWLAALLADVYHFNIQKTNLWLFLFLTALYNPLNLKQKKLLGWFAISGVLALFAINLNIKTYGVWLYGMQLVMAFILGVKDDVLSVGKLIIFSAAFFNLGVLTNTAATDIQYDFPSCYNYIEYIIENNFMFWRENPLLTRPSYSAYHPILHFWLAAVGLKVGMFIADNKDIATNALQVIFWCYMVWYYVLAQKILHLLKLKPAAELAGLAFLCFFPQYNAIAGFFNNDCLLLPLQAGVVYYALCYWQVGGKKNLFLIWVFALLAALTKLSGVIVLPMAGVALLLRLWQTKSKQTFVELLIFGVLLILGLAIWPVYQHVFLGVGFDFVPPQPHLSLEQYSLWQRFNPLGAIVYEKMFYNDFGINLWETMTKTALFGQWDFSMRGAQVMNLIVLLMWGYKALIIGIAIAVVYLTLTRLKYIKFILNLILLLAILAAQISFGLKHPYMCNQDFRYVAILALPMAMIWAQFLDVCPKVIRISGIGLTALFALLSATVWWWVVHF